MKNIKIILYIITLVITNNSISLSEVTPSVPTNMLQQIVSSSFSDQNFSTPELQVEIQNSTNTVINTEQLRETVQKDAETYGLLINKKVLAQISGEESEEEEEEQVVLLSEKNKFGNRTDLEPTLGTYVYDSGLMDLELVENSHYAADGDPIFNASAGAQQARVRVYIDFVKQVQWGDVESRITFATGTQKITHVNGASSGITSLPINRQLNYFVKNDGTMAASSADEPYLFDKHANNSFLKADGTATRFDADGAGDHNTDSNDYKEFNSFGTNGLNNVAVQALFVGASSVGTTTASFEASNGDIDGAGNISDADFKAGLVRYEASVTMIPKVFEGPENTLASELRK